MWLPIPPRRKQPSQKTITRKKHFNHFNSALRVGRSSFRRVVTPHGKSRVPSEVTKPMPLLTTQATMNIKSMECSHDVGNGGKMQRAEKIKRHDLKILRIRETQWLQAESQGLSSKQVLLYTAQKNWLLACS